MWSYRDVYFVEHQGSVHLKFIWGQVCVCILYLRKRERERVEEARRERPNKKGTNKMGDRPLANLIRSHTRNCRNVYFYLISINKPAKITFIPGKIYRIIYYSLTKPMM